MDEKAPAAGVVSTRTYVIVWLCLLALTATDGFCGKAAPDEIRDHTGSC